MKLRPMSEAPKDREIFAAYLRRDMYGTPMPGKIDAGNFHPLQWIDYPWKIDNRPHWGMRWNPEFIATLADYGGWIDPKDLAVDR